MDRTKAPEVRPFGRLHMPDENVEILPNGITFHTFSGGEQPICRLSVYFPGGACELGNEAIGRVLMSSLTDGTEKFDADEIAEILDFNGARVGGRANSHYSSFDISMLNGSVPALIEPIEQMLVHPVFPERRLETVRLRERTRLLTARAEVAYAAEEAFLPLVYGSGHPLARPLTEEDIDAISRETLVGIHKRMLCPTGIHVFLSGLLTDDVVLPIKELMASIPRLGDGYSVEVTPSVPVAGPAAVEVPRPDSLQSALLAGLPEIGRGHPDYIPLRYTVMALGGYFGSRLMRNIREEKGLTYGISAALMGAHEGAYMSIAARFDKSYTAAVLEEIKAEMRRMATNPPEGDELRRLKLHAGTSLAEVLDTPVGIMGYYATQLLVGTPKEYFAMQQDVIDALTPDLIAEMARKYLNPDKLLTSLAGV